MSLFRDLASGVVGGLLNKVAPEVGGYFREKQQLRHAIEIERLRGKERWEIRKTERADRSEGRDHEWELASLAAHNKTWKDEWVLIVLSIPAVLAFTPYDHIVANGFVALQETPYWYQAILASVFLAVYGIRWMRQRSNEKDLMTKFHEMELARTKRG
jgi:hypothetical protein